MRRTSNLFTAAFHLNAKEEAQQRAEVLELLEDGGAEDVKDELATSLPYGKQRRLETPAPWPPSRSCCCWMSLPPA